MSGRLTTPQQRVLAALFANAAPLGLSALMIAARAGGAARGRPTVRSLVARGLVRSSTRLGVQAFKLTEAGADIARELKPTCPHGLTRDCWRCALGGRA